MAIILIVDDRPTNRQFLVTLLGYRGHQLLEAGDGAEALALVRAEHPVLVITDILMPTMDGFEFVRRLRADPAVSGTAVIFYTAEYQRPEVHSLAETIGVTHHLTKPAEPEEILRTVENVLEMKLAPAPARAEGFDRQHLRLLTDKLAQQVYQLEVAHRRQAAVAELGQRALTTVDPSTLMADTVVLVARTLGVDYCQVVELEPRDSAHTPGARVAWKAGTIVRATGGAGDDSQASFTLLCPEPVIVEDLRTEVRFRDLSLLREHGVISGLSVVVPGHDRPFGVLGAHTIERRLFTLEESDFLRAIANVLGAAVERSRAEQALAANAERLQVLTRRLLGVQEAERRRIARELHDDVGQCLTAAKMAIDRVARDLTGPGVHRWLADAASMTGQALEHVRDLSRLLRPSLLDDLGLPAALSALVESLAERAGLDADVEVEDVGPVDSDAETACYRVAQEALNNAVKHAGATRLRVALRRADDELEMVIDDDGSGFDVVAAKARAVRGSSLGLLSLLERAELAGGRAEITSRPGLGTRIRALVPAATRASVAHPAEENH